MNRCARCFSDLSALAVFCPQCAQANQPDFEQLVGQIIGERYRLERRLSQGGLATVLAATDLQTRQPVVVKISNPAQLARREQSFALEPEDARNYWNEMLARMEREAEVLAGISHPNFGAYTYEAHLPYRLYGRICGRASGGAGHAGLRAGRLPASASP